MEKAEGIDVVDKTVSSPYCGRSTELAPVIGAAAAVVVASIYGRPPHAIVTFWVMLFATGLGLNLGFHRLFAHCSSQPFVQSSGS
jgi:fatty-acid desaturase